MTKDAFQKFSVCLQYLSPGNAPAWDDGCARFYYALLADVPDADAPQLMLAVGKEFRFRPAPQEVLDLWRRATADVPVARVEEMVGTMLRLRSERGLYHQRVPGDPWRRMEACEPPWSDPHMARLSAAMGGWRAFCEDPSPRGVLHGQLARAAALVLAGGQETAVDRLRLEYRELRRQTEAVLLPPAEDLGPALGPVEGDGDGALTPLHMIGLRAVT